MIVKFGQKKRDNDPFQTQRKRHLRLYSLTILLFTTINVKKKVGPHITKSFFLKESFNSTIIFTKYIDMLYQSSGI